MNKKIMEQMGFSEQIKLVELNKCPFCNKPVEINEFRDEISKKEYKISGLCQECQDKTFR